MTTYDYRFKVILCGDAGTGKSTLANRFLTNLFKSDNGLTIGVEFYTQDLTIDGKRVKLEIWHYGSEERFRFLLPTYTRGAEGGFLIYDITNYSTLVHLDNWLTLILNEIKFEEQFPIIVVGNKADLDDDREVSAEEGIQFAKARDVDVFIECSAKTGENVKRMFEALTELMIENRETSKTNNTP